MGLAEIAEAPAEQGQGGDHGDGLAGGVLAYFTVGQALDFLIAWSGSEVDQIFSVSSYVGLIGLMIFAFGLGFLLPVFIWNAQHDWSTVRHLMGHLGMQGGDIATPEAKPWSPLWTLEYVGLTLAACGPPRTGP